MLAIMADNDIQGHMNALMHLVNSEAWRDLWVSLNVAVRTFAELDLPSDVSDAALWHRCQQERIVLLTGNRNKEGAESLEATIQTFNTSTSLPVFTLADPNQVLTNRAYANRVIETMLLYLMEIDNVCGTGRLWLP